MLTLLLSATAAADWLLQPPDAYPPASIVESSGKTITLKNGLLSRTFTTSPNFASVSYAAAAARPGAPSSEMLRTIRPEAIITLDGIRYHVGGLVADAARTECAMDACPDAARRGIFTDESTLATMQANTSSWGYVSHKQTPVHAPFSWQPGTRNAPADVHWPPLGTALEVTLSAPADAPAAHRALQIIIRYELLTGAPVLTKSLQIVDTRPQPAPPPHPIISELIVETLAVTQPYSPLPLVPYPPTTRT